ncbi:MAG: HAMP domain-containing sensor histidine kinase [Gemmatimonadota bacterium]
MTNLPSELPDDFADRLVHLDRAQTVQRMLRGLSHEFRNQLQVVSLAAGLDTTVADPDLAARIEGAIDALSEGFSLLGRLSRSLDEHPPQARLGACLDQLRTLEALQLGLPAVRLEIIAPDERLVVRAPETAFVHVLLTLVTNAKEAAGQGPNGVVTLTVTTGEPGRLVLTIADNGSGFGDRPVRAEPFCSSRDAREHGGIGLAAATTLLARYGGSLEMKPGAKGGAVARLVVPGG